MADSWTVRDLLNAGWGDSDLEWEREIAEAVDAFASGDAAAARDKMSRSLQLARKDFDAHDPRLATSLANFAACRREGGSDAAQLFAEAQAGWAACGPWVEAMKAPRSARSSMFHMRMEQKHRATYEERWRIKWRELVEEAQGRLQALAAAERCDKGAARAAAERWRRECPALLNDTRKLMAAVILLLAPE